MNEMTYRGKKVTLNKNHNNAAISVTLLPEEEMRKLGFTDFMKDRWYYCKPVNKRGDISFNLTIPKDNPDGWKIDVLDEDFCQPYDYQYMLSQGSTNEVAKAVDENVEKEMQRLTDAGVISRHSYGDYI